VALGAGPTNSFTQKLLIEVRHRAQYGEKLVEVAGLINAVRQSLPIKKPTHGIRLGMGSITLPLNSTVAAAPPRALIKRRHGLLATFSLHVLQTFSNEELKGLVAQNRRLPP
jgi:hypothetical protein